LAPPRAKRPTVFYGWVIVAASFSAMSVYGFFFSFGVFYKPLMDHFGWSATEVAVAPSIMSIVYLLTVMPMSLAYKRFGLRPVIILGSLLMASGLALCGQATASWQLYLFFGVLASIGTSTLWVPFSSTIMNWFSKKRGLAMAIALSGAGFGSLYVPPLLAYLIIVYGWRTAFLVAGFLSFSIVFSAGLVMKKAPEEIGLRPYGDVLAERSPVPSPLQESRDEAIHARTVRGTVRGVEFWLLYGLWLLSTIVKSVYDQQLVLYAITIGITVITASIALGTIGLSSIVGRLFIGLLLDKIGTRRALALCFLLNLVSSLLLLLTNNELSLYLFAVIFGLSFGGRTTLEVPIVGEFFGLADLVTILGILETAFGVGGFVGPYLAGRIYDVTGRYFELFSLCAILSAILLAISMSLKPAKRAKTTHSQLQF